MSTRADPPELSAPYTVATMSKEDELLTPIFLRKSFDMISTCDPAVASWCDEGTNFVIKEPELFASTIIPSYFKHAKLSSFIRQLNFYGFRKVKSNPLRLRGAEQGRQLKFGHRFFIQDRIDLLHHVKKAKDSSTDQADIAYVKNRNEEIKMKLSTLTEDVKRLKAAVPKLRQKVEHESSPCAVSPIQTDQTIHSHRNRFAKTMAFQDLVESDDFSIESLHHEGLLPFGGIKGDPTNSKSDFGNVQHLNAHVQSLDRNIATQTDQSRQNLSCLSMEQQALLADRLVGVVCRVPDLQDQIDAAVASLSAPTPRPSPRPTHVRVKEPRANKRQRIDSSGLYEYRCDHGCHDNNSTNNHSYGFGR